MKICKSPKIAKKKSKERGLKKTNEQVSSNIIASLLFLLFWVCSFEMGPEEVVEFCANCVLSEEEEPCDIPDGFYDKLMP